jgi:hypothetical protein
LHDWHGFGGDRQWPVELVLRWQQRSNGGTTASCSAPYSPAPINGQCGPANGVAVSTAPTTGLCSVGLASSVTGTGPWNWSCAGSNGGTAASCQAPTAQSSGIIPANRRTLWQPGLTYNGGIPNRTTIYTTLSPSGGDDTPAIQTAINNCPAGQVVLLTAGTFSINGGGISVFNSNCTLRGAGPGTGATGGNFANDNLSVLKGGGTGTFLVKSDRLTQTNFGILSVGHAPDQFNPSINLASDAVQGAYSVTLASTSGLSVGQVVLVDENTDNDPDVVWGPSFGGPGDASRSWFSRQDRSLNQMMQITAINGNAVTFATPFHHTYSVANQAQLSTYIGPMISGVGIEEMTLMGGQGGQGNIHLWTCQGCWVKHVESYWTNGPSIELAGCYQCEVRDSYMHETPNTNPGGAGYLFAMDFGTSESLVENNIMSNGNKVIVMRATGGGNVIAYNYMDDSWGETYPDEPEAGVNAGHYTTAHMELIEGNYSHHYNADSFWGNSVDITVFRNWLSGIRAAHGWLKTYTVKDGSGNGLIPYADYGGVTGRNTVDIQAYNYRHNLVGNVLGEKGQTLLPAYTNGDWNETAQTAFAYETLSNFPAPGIVSMWVMGSYQPGGNWSWVTNTYQTILRQGNWDWYTQLQTWYASPIGASGTPGDGTPQTIPSSLYLTGKPAFFGTNTWPWVDPSTGTTYTLPAKARFDAGKPNTLQ